MTTKDKNMGGWGWDFFSHMGGMPGKTPDSLPLFCISWGGV